ncbi:toxin-antitoxin system HicB family antitoxin [Variovorax sp. NFACC27]|uniref:toxin-antitoxin system HicB family antitoxin n=1 Tax=unclassified Variovorax TaxID=663243 RepID=UPI000B88D7E7
MEEDRYTRITLRLPKELHARLDAAADRTSKSLNAEIVGRLEESFVMNVDALTSSLIAELQKTQQELTKSRLRAAVDDARHRKRGATAALEEARRTKAEPSLLRNLEAEAVSAHADLVEAEELLAGTLAILDNSFPSPGPEAAEYLIHTKDRDFRRMLKQDDDKPSDANEARVPIRRRKLT